MHHVYISFQTSFCNGPETELKFKIGFRTYLILANYHIQTVGALSVLVLMYPTTVNIMCVSVLAKELRIFLYRLLNDVFFVVGIENEVHRKNILMRGTPSQIEFL
jgi:hypothetical protein